MFQRVVLIALFCLLAVVIGQQQLSFQASLSGSSTEWDHYWEKCVGSGHALLGLREDWRRDLKTVHDSLGFQYVRFHGVLDDDMSVVLSGAPNPTYSFYNIDSLYDNLVSIGMKPVVELGFMPEVFARNASETIFHYKGITSPPANISVWNEFMKTLVTHFVGRYGLDEVNTWFFEVWNEPNCGFFSGTKAEYFAFLKSTSDAIHSAYPSLRVGGPATCSSGWIEETVQMIKSGDLKIDFISTHMYPTDYGTPVKRNVMLDVISGVKAMVGDMPLLYTEYNDGLYSDPPLHDTSFASAFILKNIVDLHGYVELLSWWTFTDIFEEGGLQSPVFGKTTGWGLLGLYGIPKPSFRAFELLHHTGSNRLSVSPQPNYYPTVGALATTNNTHVTVLIWNYNTPTQPIASQTVTFTLQGYNKTFSQKAILQRIDDEHCNPYKEWNNQGSPEYPTPAQIQALVKASELVDEDIQVSQSQDALKFTLDLPPLGVAAVVLPLPN